MKLAPTLIASRIAALQMGRVGAFARPGGAYMKPLRTLLLLPALLGGALAGAQEDFQAERDRIAAERQALETRFQQQETACYQRFAVNDCLSQARRARRSAEDDLKRQEAAINDIERKRRGAEQLRRIDERQATPRTQDRPEEQQKAREAQQAREQRAADHAASRAAKAAEEAQNRQDAAGKQRQFAEDQERAARQRAEAPTERERFENKQRSVQQRRAERERKNAERTKPPAAPLPPPPR